MNGLEAIPLETVGVQSSEARPAAFQSEEARSDRLPSANDAPTPKKDYVRARVATKVHDQHRDRLAVVYVRQSTQHQVVEHRESLARQYALRDDALALGWASDRILVIDEDLGLSGRSADERHGFQRLLTEVTMDHVGIVSGLEMSRLARSSRDWHQLFELCGAFGTLLADEDGVYDPNDPNDRLLLGLKGIMSEVELHTMRCRLERGKLNKAQRGQLFLHVPVGYVKTPNDGVALDPDEQVRSVVHLVFDKFNELGSVCEVFRYLRRHGIKIGIRPIEGPNRGQLEWRAVGRTLMFSMLHHPIYAGVYAYGRCPVDPKRRRPRKDGRYWAPRNEWKVTLHGHIPAYITWDQYLSNQERLKQNRSHLESKGRPRRGTALLGGLVYCGGCGARLSVTYGATGKGRYECVRHFREGVAQTCHGVMVAPIDTLVTQQILKALEPASIDLGVQAAANIQRERERLTTHWKQTIERARYEARQAERYYRAVDPENRLVARTLEQQWEAALGQERQTREEFERFQRDTPARLSAAEDEQIRALSREIPALWHATETTPPDRKAILQCLIDRVVASPRGNTEFVDVTIHWSGGFVSQHVVRRPVMRYQQLEDYPRMVALIREARAAGRTAAQIAEQLNQEGFHAPLALNKKFTNKDVCNILRRLGIRRPLLSRDRLQPNEWWREDLANELRIHPARLHYWVRKGYLHARRDPSTSKYWILWADADELQRLRQLRDYLKTEHRIGYPAELKRPKPRPEIEPAISSGSNSASDTAPKPPLADPPK